MTIKEKIKSINEKLDKMDVDDIEKSEEIKNLKDSIIKLKEEMKLKDKEKDREINALMIGNLIGLVGIGGGLIIKHFLK